MPNRRASALSCSQRVCRDGTVTWRSHSHTWLALLTSLCVLTTSGMARAEGRGEIGTFARRGWLHRRGCMARWRECVVPVDASARAGPERRGLDLRFWGRRGYWYLLPPSWCNRSVRRGARPSAVAAQRLCKTFDGAASYHLIETYALWLPYPANGGYRLAPILESEAGPELRIFLFWLGAGTRHMANLFLRLRGTLTVLPDGSFVGWGLGLGFEIYTNAQLRSEPNLPRQQQLSGTGRAGLPRAKPYSNL